ncbi:hypothetical protein HDU92_002342 [Lobulomyces angularis]|nr:hypothetical protein HDU92_002342 [Lobulomyces angularis]
MRLFNSNSVDNIEVDRFTNYAEVTKEVLDHNNSAKKCKFFHSQEVDQQTIMKNPTKNTSGFEFDESFDHGALCKLSISPIVNKKGDGRSLSPISRNFFIETNDNVEFDEEFVTDIAQKKALNVINEDEELKLMEEKQRIIFDKAENVNISPAMTKLKVPKLSSQTLPQSSTNIGKISEMKELNGSLIKKPENTETVDSRASKLQQDLQNLMEKKKNMKKLTGKSNFVSSTNITSSLTSSNSSLSASNYPSICRDHKMLECEKETASSSLMDLFSNVAELKKNSQFLEKIEKKQPFEEDDDVGVFEEENIPCQEAFLNKKIFDKEVVDGSPAKLDNENIEDSLFLEDTPRPKQSHLILQNNMKSNGLETPTVEKSRADKNPCDKTKATYEEKNHISNYEQELVLATPTPFFSKQSQQRFQPETNINSSLTHTIPNIAHCTIPNNLRTVTSFIPKKVVKEISKPKPVVKALEKAAMLKAEEEAKKEKKQLQKCELEKKKALRKKELLEEEEKKKKKPTNTVKKEDHFEKPFDKQKKGQMHYGNGSALPQASHHQTLLKSCLKKNISSNWSSAVVNEEANKKKHFKADNVTHKSITSSQNDFEQQSTKIEVAKGAELPKPNINPAATDFQFARPLPPVTPQNNIETPNKSNLVKNPIFKEVDYSLVRSKFVLDGYNSNEVKRNLDTIVDENGELPDINSDEDLSSNDSSNSEDENTSIEEKKRSLPDWAKQHSLNRTILSQMKIDPETIFGKIGDCDLEEIFKNSSTKTIKKFKKRTSSANWSGADQLAKNEEERYKKQMGYL